MTCIFSEILFVRENVIWGDILTVLGKFFNEKNFPKKIQQMANEKANITTQLSN
jgi:hypothetical protein